MNISATYTNIRNNTVVETIKDVVLNNGYAKITVESVEFDGLMTIKNEFIAKIPVLVIK